MSKYTVIGEDGFARLDRAGEGILANIKRKLGEGIELSDWEWEFLDSHKGVINLSELGLTAGEVYERAFDVALKRTRGYGCTCGFVRHADGKHIRTPDYQCPLHYGDGVLKGQFAELGILL